MDPAGSTVEKVSDQVDYQREYLKWYFAIKPTQVKPTPPDFVQVVSILKAVGFEVKSIAVPESSTPNTIEQGCNVNVQCPVSKIYANLVSNDSKCLCPKQKSSSTWSVTWAGATAGEDKVDGAGNDSVGTSLIPDLSPDKSQIIRHVLKALVKCVWLEEGSEEGEAQEVPSPEKKESISKDQRRLFKSLESLPVNNLERSFELEYMRSVSVATNNVSSAASSEADPNESMGSNISFDSQASASPPHSTCSARAPVKPKSKPQRHSLPNSRSVINRPSEIQKKMDKDAYMQSAMMRAKRYAESLKNRDSLKQKPATRK